MPGVASSISMLASPTPPARAVASCPAMVPGRILPLADEPGRLAVYQPRSPASRASVRDLARMPDAVWTRLFATGLRAVWVGDVPIPCFPGESQHAHDHPTGWPRGYTWMQVGGTYDCDQQVVIAGHAPDDGSVSTPLHETGHAIGHLLGYDDSPVLAAFQRAMYRRLDPYFQQGGAGGATGSHELLAEGIATYLRLGPRATAREFSPRFSRWIGSILSAR